MTIPLKFRMGYFMLAILIFGLEIFIALYVHDTIIRPYIGDLLVVILLYCFVKSFADLPVFPTAISVLLFSFLIEISQYFKIIELLGLQNSALARVVMGTSFAWIDLMAYIGGIAIVLFVEKLLSGKLKKNEKGQLDKSDFFKTR